MKNYLLPARITLFVLLLINTTLSAQMLYERDILMTEYPVFYDNLRNEIVENQITDRFIKANRVKTLTESYRYEYNGSDTLLPVQCLYYDSMGLLSRRDLYYYGNLFFSEYFSYSGNNISVHYSTYEHTFRRMPDYKVDQDASGNPIKYVRYNQDSNREGPDSILYKYSYDSGNRIRVKQQEMFYSDEPPEILAFKYTYNSQGQNTSYIVSRAGKEEYSVHKEYTNTGLIQKRSAIYTDGNNYYDDTEYTYGGDSKIAFIKQRYRHEPLADKEPATLYIQFIYDKYGFLSEKYDVTDKEKNFVSFHWEFYR